MEQQIAFPSRRGATQPFLVLIAGIFCALLFNKRISYWLIGLFAHTIIHTPSPLQLILIASCATLENFIFFGSSIESLILCTFLGAAGVLTRKYFYRDMAAVTLITLVGLAFELIFIEYYVHRLSISGLYTFLKLSVTLGGVWVVSLKSKLFDR